MTGGAGFSRGEASCLGLGGHQCVPVHVKTSETTTSRAFVKKTTKNNELNQRESQAK